MKLVFITVILAFSVNSWGQSFPRQSPSDKEIDVMAAHNRKMAERESVELGPVVRPPGEIRPFYEWDTTGYLVMSEDNYYGHAKHIKELLAEHIPQDVTLIVYTHKSSAAHQTRLLDFYAQFRPKESIKILYLPSGGRSSFWTRDNTPVPVWEDDAFSLVDAKYYYNFEPDQIFSDFFGGTMSSHKYFFEGGNFMANGKGDCIVVNRKRSYPGGVSDTGAIPDSIFESQYGCQRLIRLKHLKGIGHSDEVVKFMTDDIVLTDTEAYVETLEEAGFQVRLLPEPEQNYETYINSLIVNDVVFVPTFGEAGDERALEVYDSLGLDLKIVPVPSKALATRGQGGIHCITMNYPPAPLGVLKRALAGKSLEEVRH